MAFREIIVFTLFNCLIYCHASQLRPSMDYFSELMESWKVKAAKACDSRVLILQEKRIGFYFDKPSGNFQYQSAEQRFVEVFINTGQTSVIPIYKELSDTGFFSEFKKCGQQEQNIFRRKEYGSSIKGWEYSLFDSQERLLTDFDAHSVINSNGLYYLTSKEGPGMSLKLSELNIKTGTESDLKLPAIIEFNYSDNIQNLILGNTTLKNDVIYQIREGSLKDVFVGQDRSNIGNFEKFDLIHENRKMPAVLMLPNNKEYKGVVISLHGGSYDGSADFVNNIASTPERYALLEQGFIVYAINTYGDKTFDDNYKSPSKKRALSERATDEVNDIFLAFDQVRSKFQDLPIFLMGFSHGAYLTNLIGTKYSRQRNFSGYISLFGAWDVSIEDGYSHGSTKGTLAVSDRFFNDDSGKFSIAFTYDEEVVRRHGKTTYRVDKKLSKEEAISEIRKLRSSGKNIDYLYFSAPDEYYERTNPILFVQNVEKPFFVVHGMQDSNVYPINSSILKDHLTPEVEKYFTIKVYDEEGHGVFTKKNFNNYLNSIIKFLSTNI